MNRKSINKLLSWGIPVLVITAGVLFVVILRTWHGTTMDEQLKQREQLQFNASGMESGMTKIEVLGILKKQEWTSYQEMDGEIRLWTQPQPLPTNWGVRLFFKNDKLTSIRYFNADNISKRPEGAPPDIVE